MEENPKTVYANFVQVHGSAFDVAFDFGMRIGNTDEPSPDVRVVMSWEHLSTMVPILQGMLDSYQEQLGELPKMVAEPTEEEAR